MNLPKFNRKIHKWGAIIAALPIIIVICSGLLLMLKKELAWLQPPTQSGTSEALSISFDEILTKASQIPEAQIKDWGDIDRLDVRPGKGVVKVRSKNSIEIQLDTSTGEALQVMARRSDLIESIHDGSFFHSNAKLWLFLPSCVVMLILWFTGLYLFLHPYINRRKKNKA